MSRIYTGDVPCSGCGKSGKESRRSYKDGICFQCLDDLKEYGLIRKRNIGKKDCYVEFDVIAHEIKYQSNNAYGNLIASLKELFTSLDTPEADEHSTGMQKIRHGNYYNNSFRIMRDYSHVYNGTVYHGDGAFVIREDIALRLDALISALENYSHSVYLEGKQDGGNLLKSLGKHEISPDEFIERINREKYK